MGTWLLSKVNPPQDCKGSQREGVRAHGGVQRCTDSHWYVSWDIYPVCRLAGRTLSLIQQGLSSQGPSCTRPSLCQHAAAEATVQARLPDLDSDLFPFGGVTEAFRESLCSKKPLPYAVPFPPADPAGVG